MQADFQGTAHRESRCCLTEGVILAIALARLMGSLLYGVCPGDPAVFVSVITAIVVTAMVSSWVSAQRAAGVDPMQALRDE